MNRLKAAMRYNAVKASEYAGMLGVAVFNEWPYERQLSIYKGMKHYEEAYKTFCKLIVAIRYQRNAG